MEHYISFFESTHKVDSLLACTLIPDLVDKGKIVNGSWVDPTLTNGLHMNNANYIYTNPPPYGHGTPAPKVAETVLRSYSYNLKQENKVVDIEGWQIENCAVQNIEEFNFDGISGNYCPASVYLMSKAYYMKNRDVISEEVEKTVDWFRHTSCDLIAAGNQTWDPEIMKSVTNSRAFINASKLIEKNLHKTPSTLLELFMMFLEMSRSPQIRGKERFSKMKTFKRFNKRSKAMITGKRKILIVKSKLYKGDQVKQFMLNHARSFCSYIKHGERGKKDRRAIASTGIFLRLLLKFVEEFHLRLAKRVEGNTISIGGEEKKKKIISELKGAIINDELADEFKVQGTEDASKWNECLQPSLFNIVHQVFVDPVVLGRPVTENEEFFGHICNLTFFIMNIKRIHLGPGVQLESETTLFRPSWWKMAPSQLNQRTQEWYLKALPLLDEKDYLYSSPGFLMGMLNAASTTIGLLPSNFIKMEGMRVMTLRSSDDSMSIYIGTDPCKLKCAIHMNKLYSKLLGINMSDAKTLFCVEGFGEFTSWYQDGDFVGQSGVETVSLRPGGRNPQDDFNSIAIHTSTLLRTHIINFAGALCRLSTGIKNVQRLWRIKTNDRDDLSPGMLFLSDGGSSAWNIENCFMDESSIRFTKAVSEKDKSYFVSIMAPDNPFSELPEEKLYYSKSTGALTFGAEDFPSNIFTFVQQSNRSNLQVKNKAEMEEERTNKRAYDIMTTLDPTLFLSVPSNKLTMAENIVDMLNAKKYHLDFSDQEKADIIKAMSLLSNILDDNFSDDDASSDEDDGPMSKRVKMD